MPEIVNWREKKFEKDYNEEFEFLHRRLKNDPTCTLEDLQGILQSLYVTDDNNLGGRSEVAQISLSASIAAYEAFIAELKSKKGGK